MVQQTKDSAFTEYGLAHAESGLSKSDKQLSAPLAAKKSELHALRRNESPTTVSRSIGSPFLMEHGEVATKEVKISGTKRPTHECMRGPAEVNSRSGHIVYVRRKPEIDLAKRNIRDAQSDAVGCPQLKKLTDQDETPQQLMEINKPVICASDGAPLQRTSSSIGISSKNSSPENIEHFHLDCANPSPEDAIAVNVMLWEERNCHLQSVLKMMDQSDQYGYVQMLRSLSSVELSRHAVELEKRSIKLSLEEAKEMQRVRFIDVSGKYGKNVWTPSTQEEALQKKRPKKKGARLLRITTSDCSYALKPICTSTPDLTAPKITRATCSSDGVRSACQLPTTTRNCTSCDVAGEDNSTIEDVNDDNDIV